MKGGASGATFLAQRSSGEPGTSSVGNVRSRPAVVTAYSSYPRVYRGGAGESDDPGCHHMGLLTGWGDILWHNPVMGILLPPGGHVTWVRKKVALFSCLHLLGCPDRSIPDCRLGRSVNSAWHYSFSTGAYGSVYRIGRGGVVGRGIRAGFNREGTSSSGRMSNFWWLDAGSALG